MKTFNSNIVTNEFGIFIVKNNNYDVNLTNDEISNIQNTTINIKKKMESDFQKVNPQYEGILEDDKDDKYYQDINNFVKKCYADYDKLYQDCLRDYGFRTIFIRTK